jgi:hypothetical protein
MRSALTIAWVVGCGGDDGSMDTGAGTEATAAADDDGGGSRGGDDGSTAGGANGSGDGAATGGDDDDGDGTTGDDASATGDDGSGGIPEIVPCHRPNAACELGESCTSDNGTQCSCAAVCQGAKIDPPPPPAWACVEPSSAGCPAGQPSDGEPCSGSLHCTYGLPAGCGGARADCVDGVWVVEVLPVPP